MSARYLFLPVVLLAAVAFVAPIEAEAGPRHRHGRHLHHGHGRHIGPHRAGFVGGAVTIPIRQRGGHYREVVEYVGGFYETRTREVEVPGRQIGWDMRGKAIFAGSRVEIETYEVWVPRRRVVRRVWVPARPVATVTIGGRVRVR